MENADRIACMDAILNGHMDVLERLAPLLDYLEAHRAEFEALEAYYGSEEQHRDLDTLEAGRLPPELPHAVLGEDLLWNLLGDYAQLGQRLKRLGNCMCPEN